MSDQDKTAESAGPSAPSSFPQFSRLPAELQKLVWENAMPATGSGAIHFLEMNIKYPSCDMTAGTLTIIPMASLVIPQLLQHLSAYRAEYEISRSCTEAKKASDRMATAPGVQTWMVHPTDDPEVPKVPIHVRPEEDLVCLTISRSLKYRHFVDTPFAFFGLRNICHHIPELASVKRLAFAGEALFACPICEENTRQAEKARDWIAARRRQRSYNTKVRWRRFCSTHQAVLEHAEAGGDPETMRNSLLAVRYSMQGTRQTETRFPEDEEDYIVTMESYEECVSVCSDDFEDDLDMYNREERRFATEGWVPREALDETFENTVPQTCPMSHGHYFKMSNQILDLQRQLPGLEQLYIVVPSIYWRNREKLPRSKKGFEGHKYLFFEVDPYEPGWEIGPAGSKAIIMHETLYHQFSASAMNATRIHRMIKSPSASL